MPRENLTTKRQRAQSIEKIMFEQYGEEPAPRLPDAVSVERSRRALRAMHRRRREQSHAPSCSRNTERPRPWPAHPPLRHRGHHPFARVLQVEGENLVALAQTLLADFGGEVPNDVDELQKLPELDGRRRTSSCAKRSKPSGNRRRHPCVPHRPPPRLRDAKRRHARENRGEAAQDLSAKRLALHQPTNGFISGASSAAPATRCACSAGGRPLPSFGKA